MHSSDIRNEIAGVLNLLPLISVCLEHPKVAGVRYAACQCVRALGRSVRVLRTSLLDSGVGITLCQIVEKQDEDRRVMNIALAGLCNLLTDFSPLRQVGSPCDVPLSEVSITSPLLCRPSWTEESSRESQSFPGHRKTKSRPPHCGQ